MVAGRGAEGRGEGKELEGLVEEGVALGALTMAGLDEQKRCRQHACICPIAGKVAGDYTTSH